MKSINDIKTIIESGKVTKAYFRFTENVDGYFQLKSGQKESDLSRQFFSQYGKANLKWGEIDGWETIQGKYDSEIDTWEGSYYLRTEQEIDLKWLNDNLKSFINYTSFDISTLNLYEFLEFIGYGQDGFDMKSEMGISFYDEPEGFVHHPCQTYLETDKCKADIEVGMITYAFSEDIELCFETD